MPSIIKAYLQSPRLWVTIGAAALAWFKGNEMGLTDEMILYIVELLAMAFGVSVSVRAPREWEFKKDVPSA